MAVDVVMGAASYPSQRVVTRFNRQYDTKSSYLTDAVTFDQLGTYVKAGDDGDPTTAIELVEEMIAKDDRLQSVANTRRLALTGADWSIEPGGDAPEDEVAARYCEDTLRATGPVDGVDNSVGFDLALEHLSEAIGPNLAGVETLWKGSRPAGFLCLGASRFAQELSRTPRLLIVTNDNPSGELPEADKFILHTPRSNGGRPFKSTLGRATAKLWLIKAGAMADWAAFCELFGIPMRVGRYPRDASGAERDLLKAGLRDLGSDGAAIFPDGWELQLIESASRTGQPFETLADSINKAFSILWLGATLTTDTTGGTGTFAAARIHEDVRNDILYDDARKESVTVGGQLLRPMTRYRFPGQRVAVPRFVRDLAEPKDTAALAATISTAVNDLGLKVGADWAYETLGIERPADGAELLAGRPQPAALPGLGGSPGGFGL